MAARTRPVGCAAQRTRHTCSMHEDDGTGRRGECRLPMLLFVLRTKHAKYKSVCCHAMVRGERAPVYLHAATATIHVQAPPRLKHLRWSWLKSKRVNVDGSYTCPFPPRNQVTMVLFYNREPVNTIGYHVMWWQGVWWVVGGRRRQMLRQEGLCKSHICPVPTLSCLGCLV